MAHDGVAVLVDPLRDIDTYVAFLEDNKLRLKGILLTHAHADYVGGHAELARRTQAPVFYGHRVVTPKELGIELSPDESSKRVSVCPVIEGDVLSLSSVCRLRALETPGHTPGCVTWVLERDGGEGGFAAFTGDCLFIGSCGRPDLVAGAGFTRAHMAGLMYKSLRKLSQTLSQDCLILPAHGAGSPCGKSLSSKLFDTLRGQLGRFQCGRPANQPLHLATSGTEEDFVQFLVGDGAMEAAPAYFSRCVKTNVSCAAPDLDNQVESVPIVGAEALLDASYTLIVDMREADEMAKWGVKGSLNFPLGTHGGMLGHEDGNFALWAGRLLQAKEETKILVLVEKERREQGLERLGRVDLVRFVKGCVDYSETLKEESLKLGVTTESRRRWLPAEIVETLAAGKEDLRFIDARTPDEFKCVKNGTVSGAMNVQLDEGIVEAAKAAGLSLKADDPGATYLCFCAGGFRSAIACSFLRREGYNVEDIKYGYKIIQDEAPELCTVKRD